MRGSCVEWAIGKFTGGENSAEVHSQVIVTLIGRARNPCRVWVCFDDWESIFVSQSFIEKLSLMHSNTRRI